MDDQRLYQKATLTNGIIKEKYFIGGLYEKEITNGIERELCYISTPAGTIAVKESKNNTDKWYFLTHDHLGSVHCILNEEGNIEQELSFDPFGNRIDPLTWQAFEDGTEPDYIFDRGYTMHEHLDNFDLINMNGRVYDPVVARFLSPDPYVQAPGYSQSFNRYSYVMNNPLKYTDPTGNKWWHCALGDVLSGGALSSAAVLFGILLLQHLIYKLQQPCRQLH
ncbi:MULTISPECIES: RHS repeat domain-containing protein [unclassified Lentimicrobium]|uniref:RHS repeat domain-containing protein n=1 Tax=unclassified Lentimicrobium TaxID=2677434 RepID=UPI001553FFBE|nr:MULTISPECIES: RHS repeat-associated core domain-containing protein [unclassified Lentimicrobium]NPD44849.1 RHS repeat-associated core domain-containing protein [Lentimicrobium sp. S6]NPD83126.1 RHS repeat-associated core domain-containing protein [Lentimicrobium sp. L6]